MSSSEGSAPHQLPTSSGGSTGAAAATCGSSEAASLLVSKVLTYSDVSTEVARTGRIVLPRIQVQQCLPELLRLCQAESALPAVRNGGPVKLSVDLVVDDEAGRTWVVLMKTWQNVVSGEHRPTFVLENTADFVRANGLAQGGTLAFCPRNGRMLLRTSLRADQLLPRQLKRAAVGAAAAGPAAKRRAAGAAVARPADAGAGTGAARSVPESVFAVAAAGGRKRKASSAAPPTPEHTSTPFWHPQACHAEEAAQALLQMHSSSLHSGGSMQSSLSGQLPLSTGGRTSVAGGRTSPAGGTRSPSPLACSTAPAAAAPTAASRHTSPPVSGMPAPAAMAGPHPLYRPHPLHTARVPAVAAAGADLLTRLQLDRAAPSTALLQQPSAVETQAQPATATAADLLPPPPPLAGTCHQYAASSGGAAAGAATAAGGLPGDALEQARRWLAAILAQQEQEQERRWVEEYNQMLLVQALQQQQQEQRQAAAVAAAQQQQQWYLAAAAAAAGLQPSRA